MDMNVSACLVSVLDVDGFVTEVGEDNIASLPMPRNASTGIGQRAATVAARTVVDKGTTMKLVLGVGTAIG